MPKSRVLWVEDFNKGKAQNILQPKFTKAAGLTDSFEIDWAYNFEDFLDKIEQDNIYDTIILDVDFPSMDSEKTAERIEKYIKTDVFKEYTSSGKGLNKAGYIASIYILRAKMYKSDRICFLSAFVPETDTADTFQDIENILSNPDKDKYSQLIDELNNKYYNLKKIDNHFKYWGDEEGDLHTWIEVREYLESNSFRNDYYEIMEKDSQKAQSFNDDAETNFNEFKKVFEDTGMQFLNCFSKPDTGDIAKNQRFKDFIDRDSDYYKFRFAVINLCNILIKWLKDTPESNDKINLKIFLKPQNSDSDCNKYNIDDFQSMLSNIISYLKGFKPNERDEKRIYKDIVMTITLFAENIKYGKNGPLYPLQRAIKALRNGIQHNSTSFDSDLDMSFCAFVVGIGLRLYFNISSKSLDDNDRSDYLKMERILIESISKNQHLPTEIVIRTIVNADNSAKSSLDFIPAYSNLTKNPKRKIDIYKLYVLCSYYKEDEIDKLDTPQNQQQICNTKFNPITGYTENSIEIEYLKRIAGLI